MFPSWRNPKLCRLHSNRLAPGSIVATEARVGGRKIAVASAADEGSIPLEPRSARNHWGSVHTRGDHRGGERADQVAQNPRLAENRRGVKSAREGGGMMLIHAALAIVLFLGLVAAPAAAEAQAAAKIHRIGLLESAPPGPAADTFGQWGAFREGLRTLGYVEGSSLAIESRWADDKYERLPNLAAELVRLNIEVFVVRTTPAALAARSVTQTIPIVILSAIDPVGAGLVVSLARPGGNITGLTTMAPDLSAKRVQLLKEMMPRLSRLAVLWNSANSANAAAWRETREAARTLGVQLQSRQGEDAKDFERAFELIARERPDALLIVEDALIVGHPKHIADFAIRERLATMLGNPAVLEGGDLIGYGPNVREMARRGAYYVDKILKGAKPAALPVEQPTKFELVINMNTAQALSLTIPPSF